jgi:hypothetical protein
MSPSTPNNASSLPATLPPEIWKMVMENLGTTHDPTDLIHCLRVSHDFFDIAASILCREVSVPLYHFERAPKHIAHHPDLPALTIERLDEHYRLQFGSSEFMRRLYKHALVAHIGPHIGCDVLAKTHPLPDVETIFIFGSGVRCESFWGKNETCCFIPSDRDVRLVLQFICPGYLCEDHTQPRLLTDRINNLVVELNVQYVSPGVECLPVVFNSCFSPTRVALCFRPTYKDRFAPDPAFRMGVTRSNSPRVLKPIHEPRPCTNFIYRIAMTCVQMPSGTQILIVGADNGVLEIRGLDAYDTSLPPFDSDLYSTDPIAFATYSMDGRLVTSRYPQGIIAAEHAAAATALVERKVAAFKDVLFAWIDDCIDPCQKPEKAPLEAEEYRGKAAYERMLAASRFRYDATAAEVDRHLHSELLELNERHDERRSLVVRGGADKPPLSQAEIEQRQACVKSRIKFVSRYEYHQLEGNGNEIRYADNYL